VRTTLGASAVAVATVAGGTVPWLRTVSVFETHDGSGPQDLPINKSAARAGVTGAALAPSYSLEVVHGEATRRLTLGDLERLPQHTERLPIACVEGWSASGDWTGVRLRHLSGLVGAPTGSTARVVSLQQRGAFRQSEVRANLADDAKTLVALRLNGEQLSIDHGYPCRLIAPQRPGVLQTKWLARIEFV
jgi:DMSO/TMAO reductase YedYZ molybdopterin-dependent catalytic subunit